MKKKKERSKKVRKKSIQDKKIVIAPLVLIIILVLIYFFLPQAGDKWGVSEDGVLSYPENRGKVDVRLIKSESGNWYVLETISFPSKDYTVEGLLQIPFSDAKVPALVILPGATVSKEGTQTLAKIFSANGYASLGIEQRNRGGVDFRYDLQLFKDRKEPVEHMMVFDALRAVDVLRQDPRIDAKRIALLGESNGGRFAMIAAALDPDIRGVIGISTSGYDTESQIINTRDEEAIRFYRSIDPETYLGLIPPRKIVMMHSVNDTIIPLDLAERTFEKAKGPKQFYRIATGNHGYSEGMRETLETELRLMLK
jgi:dipeptidyl aminopeptidase/acylaminoacyl peptidase